MKRVRTVIAVFIFCVLLVGGGKFFRYILIDDTASYTRITFHEMYEQDNIDVLFVGSSHCYRSFVPEILDREFGGVNTFNAGTSSQVLDGSYIIIQEAVKYNDVKHIYLELYYNCGFSVYKDRTDLTSVYIISDYLRPSFNKVRYMLNASRNDYYPNSFIIARRNWKGLFDADYVKELLMKKQSDEYKDYKYTYVTKEEEWYAGKGYVANKEVVENWDYFSPHGWDNIKIENMTDDWKNSLNDIIYFCDKKGVSLTLVVAPMPDFLLVGRGNYDEYVEMVKEMIDGTNVCYYDFNLCREKYFPSASEMFKDTNHLNCYGAEKLSYLFADLVNGKISEEELFYDSYIERENSLKATVFGISYHDNEDNTKDCKIVTNCDDDWEYRITLRSDTGEEYLIQDFSENYFFTVDSENHGVYTIEYRLKAIPKKIYVRDISC